MIDPTFAHLAPLVVGLVLLIVLELRRRCSGRSG